ncbi:hypothetical protein ACFV5G_07535 [Streptomyces sp. NPDC059766]|uniref:hypothetical protein n=1 Tax=Streptomyces sp. NPDC059766 TaxID=3346940 RepID=UPI00365B08D2
MCRTLVVPLLAVALSGCSLLGRNAPCTLVGAESGVSAVWRPADFGAQDAARIRLCVNSTCKERTSGAPDDPFASLFVRLPDDVGASTLPVRLTMTSAQSGDTVVEDSTRARLTEQHPNGTSCPPTAWTASFRADPVKGLVSPEGMRLQG